MSRRSGTFSFLDELTPNEVVAQVGSMLERGLLPMIEHTAGEASIDRIWTLWKLPLFDAATPEDVVSEVAACVDAHPHHRVRVLGYDRGRQVAAACFEVHVPT